MSQKSCSATGPASRHSSKQGKEAKKETQSQGTVSLFYVLCASILYRLRLTLCTLPFVLCLPCVIGRRRILHHFVSCTSPFALHFSALCRLAPCLCALPFVLCLPCVIGRHRILHHFVSCTSPFTLHSLCCVVWSLVSALCLSCFASPALSVDAGFFITLPFVLCLPCVISRRRILHHFVSCTSPFALHFSVLCRLAPCLLHFVSQFLTFHNCAARRALSEPPVSKHHCFRCHASTMPPL